MPENLDINYIVYLIALDHLIFVIIFLALTFDEVVLCPFDSMEKP